MPRHLPALVVTHAARYIGVSTIQLKVRMLIVIKLGRVPIAGGVTFRANNLIGLRLELTVVRIFMACFTLDGDSGQRNYLHGTLHLRLVTAEASDGAVTSGKCESRLAVIEERDIGPTRRFVATLASELSF